MGIPAMCKKRGAPLLLMMIAILVLLPSCGGSGSGGGGGGGGQQNNPVPSISSLLPAQAAVGSDQQVVSINGSGFMTSSTVTYNGVNHSITSYIAPTKVQIQLGGNDLATQGQFPVIVTNPAPGGGASAATNFGVVTGTPTGYFPLTVSATSGSTTHTATLYLTVQPAQ